MSKIGSNDPSIVYWDPPRPLLPAPLGRWLPLKTRTRNFGDLLGPLIVKKLLSTKGIPAPAVKSFDNAMADWKLFSVGSVLHFARDGDVVWGSGRNGKVSPDAHSFRTLDVRMVRGPKTAAFLSDRGIEVPPVYGDPGLLVPYLFENEMRDWKRNARGLTIIRNLNDYRSYKAAPEEISPRADLWIILKMIFESEIVVASSLHGFILAEAFGVKARLLSARAEPDFKYLDYLEGTGRLDARIHTTVPEAISAPDHPRPDFDPHRMIAAFPWDVFRPRAARTEASYIR